MSKFTLWCVCFIVFASCATVQLTPEEQAYMDKIKQQSLTIIVAKADAEDVWGRAQVFVSKYSSMKIQTATDYVIETYNPIKFGQYGYQATKTPKGEEVEIAVKCVPNNILLKSAADDNARMLSYYLQTGELQEKFIRR